MNKLCSNCKRVVTENSEKEFIHCTKKIMKDLILDEENRRRMINKQKNSKKN